MPPEQFEVWIRQHSTPVGVKRREFAETESLGQIAAKS
jgi:hypothetical protein